MMGNTYLWQWDHQEETTRNLSYRGFRRGHVLRHRYCKIAPTIPWNCPLSEHICVQLVSLAIAGSAPGIHHLAWHISRFCTSGCYALCYPRSSSIVKLVSLIAVFHLYGVGRRDERAVVPRGSPPPPLLQKDVNEG